MVPPQDARADEGLQYEDFARVAKGWGCSEDVSRRVGAVLLALSLVVRAVGEDF